MPARNGFVSVKRIQGGLEWSKLLASWLEKKECISARVMAGIKKDAVVQSVVEGRIAKREMQIGGFESQGSLCVVGSGCVFGGESNQSRSKGFLRERRGAC